jgi:hypothetical protein
MLTVAEAQSSPGSFAGSRTAYAAKQALPVRTFQLLPRA